MGQRVVGGEDVTVYLNALGELEIWEYISPVSMFKMRYDAEEDQPFWLVESATGFNKHEGIYTPEFLGRERLGEL